MRDADSCFIKIPSCLKQMGCNMDCNVTRRSELSRQHGNGLITYNCGHSDPCGKSNFKQHLRALTAATFLLFGLCIVLFTWNIVLWREIDKLQNHVSTLSKELNQHKEMTLSSYDVRARSRSRRRRPTRRSEENTKSNEIERRYPREIIQEENEIVRQRTKRSTLDEDAETGNMGLLSRIKKKKRIRGSRKKGKGKGRRRTFEQTSSEATAIHVKINTTDDPYEGKVLDDDIINSWSTSAVSGAVIQGFDVSEINAKNGEAGVKVLKDGIYFIYSQIVFKMNRGSQVSEKIMIGFTGHSELSACTNSLPRTHGPEDYITCYSSGIAHLRRRDKFRVKIYPSGMKVYMNPSHTYFGAFLLGEKKAP